MYDIVSLMVLAGPNNVANNAFLFKVLRFTFFDVLTFFSQKSAFLTFLFL